MVLTEIKNIRKKLAALHCDGVGLLVSDVFHLIAETLEIQTGLKLKDREGKQLDVVQFVANLETLYNQQLQELVENQPNNNVTQLDLETAIQNAKQEQNNI